MQTCAPQRVEGGHRSRRWPAACEEQCCRTHCDGIPEGGCSQHLACIARCCRCRSGRHPRGLPGCRRHFHLWRCPLHQTGKPGIAAASTVCQWYKQPYDRSLRGFRQSDLSKPHAISALRPKTERCAHGRQVLGSGIDFTIVRTGAVDDDAALDGAKLQAGTLGTRPLGAKVQRC